MTTPPTPDAVPYGYCPKCGARGKLRERRPNGNDMCENKCVYPSRDAVKEAPPTPDAVSSYEELAEQFYDATGVMAPGKDVAAAMGPYDADLLRHKLWRVWLEKRTLTAQLAAANADASWLREVVKAAVPHILANIHHVSGCLYFTPQKVCNCGTRPAYEAALTALRAAARTGAR